MGDLARLAIHQGTLERQCDLPQAIGVCARHGVRGITVRRDKLAACGLAEAKRQLASHDVQVVGISRAHLPTTPDPARRQAALDLFRRGIEEAVELGARYLIALPDGLPEGSKDLAAARARVHEALDVLLPEARAAGVPLGLEPVHPMNADFSCISRLGLANDMALALGPGIGVLIDVYHVWWDPELETEVKRARGRITGVHLSDWRLPTRDVFLDRAMPGDGVIDLERFVALVDGAGFRGFHEIEIFSERDWWRRDPGEVVRTCVERYLACC